MKIKKTCEKNIHNYYRRFKRLNTIYIWICGIFLLLALLFFVVGIPLLNNQKNAMEQYYNTQINQLQAQKEQKEEEIDAQNTSSFETTVEGQKAQYANEYTPQADDNWYDTLEVYRGRMNVWSTGVAAHISAGDIFTPDHSLEIDFDDKEITDIGWDG